MTKYITQINYIKVLLEENRIGEAFNYVNILSDGLEQTCEKIVNNLDITDGLTITKKDEKTKPGNWLYIDNNWLKLINKNDEQLHLEISKNIQVKTKYKILNEG